MGIPDTCEECEESQEVEVHCPECGQYLCADCDGMLHRRGKRARHIRKNVEAAKPATPSSLPPMPSAKPPMPSGSKKPPPPSMSSPGPQALPSMGSSGFSPSLRGAAAAGASPEAGRSPRMTAYKSFPDMGSDAGPPPPAQPSPRSPDRQSRLGLGNLNDSPGPPPSQARAAASPSTTIPAKTEPKLLMTGMLKKRKKRSSAFRVFQERYFQLWTDELKYYKRKSDKEAAGVIPLLSISSIVPLYDKSGKLFSINTSDGRTYELQAGTPTECKKWVSVMTDRMRSVQDQVDSFAPSGAKKPASSFFRPDSGLDLSQSQSGGSSGAMTQSTSGSIVDDDSGDDEGSTGPDFQYHVKSLWEDYLIPVGTVYNSANPQDQTDKALVFACKLKQPNAAEVQEAVQKLGSLDHPHIIRQMATGVSSDMIWSVYKPPGKSICRHLNRHSRFPERVVRTLGAQVLVALEYLHDNGLTFPMLSSEKIYLDPESGNAHFVDFLLCLDSKHRVSEISSPEYLCPNANKTDRRSDWWRFGILLYEMAVGFPPVRSTAATPQARLIDVAKQLEDFDPSDLPFPPFVSLEFQDIVSKLLSPSVSKRLGCKEGAEDVKRHPFFKNGRYDWSSLHTHTMPWLNEHAVDHTIVNYDRVHPKQRWKHAVTMELIEANYLPENAHGYYCQIQHESKKFSSATISNAKGSLQWNEVYNFDIVNLDNPDATVVVRIIKEGKKEGGALFGSVEFAIPEIWQQHESNEGHTLGGGGAEFQSSIIDEDGYPTFGELMVKFHLNTTKINNPLRKVHVHTLELRQAFKDFFGALPAESSQKTATPSRGSMPRGFPDSPPPVVPSGRPPAMPVPALPKHG